MDDALARQMLRQRAAGGFAFGRRARGGLCRCRHLRRRLLLGDGLLELSELELELGDDLRPALGRLAVLLTPRLGEQQLQALDLSRAPDFGRDRPSLRPRAAPPFGEDARARRDRRATDRSGLPVIEATAAELR
jgi:hypothetical protein